MPSESAWEAMFAPALRDGLEEWAEVHGEKGLANVTEIPYHQPPSHSGQYWWRWKQRNMGGHVTHMEAWNSMQGALISTRRLAKAPGDP